MTTVCVAGMGAIGTYLASKLFRSEVRLSVLARGATFERILADGITLDTSEGETIRTQPALVTLEAPGAPPDWLFVCVKAYSVPAFIQNARALIGPETRVVFIQNGLAWWQATGTGDHNRLDPNGVIAATVPLSRTVSSVTYANVINMSAGHACHLGNDLVILGRADGSQDPELERLVGTAAGSGIDFVTTQKIGHEVWKKLWGSLAFNPISALTGSTLDRIVTEPSTRPVVLAMMREAEMLVNRLGITFDITPEQRLEAAASAGAFRTSMLQDMEAGRPIELDAILGSVAELATHVGVETPAIDIVLGLLTEKIAFHYSA